MQETIRHSTLGYPVANVLVNTYQIQCATRVLLMAIK